MTAAPMSNSNAINYGLLVGQDNIDAATGELLDAARVQLEESFGETVKQYVSAFGPTNGFRVALTLEIT